MCSAGKSRDKPFNKVIMIIVDEYGEGIRVPKNFSGDSRLLLIIKTNYYKA